MDTLQLVIDSISKIAIIPQSISQGISPQPIACLDALHKLGNDEEVKDQLVQQNVVADYPYKETSMTDLRVNKKNIVEKDG